MNKIFGHDWQTIQRAQQGGKLHKTISGPIVQESATQDDLALLSKHGIDGLKQLGFFGVIDRLSRK